MEERGNSADVDPNMRLTLIDDGSRYAYNKTFVLRTRGLGTRKFIATGFLCGTARLAQI